MEIKTGNFANVKKYREAGYTTISIALSARYYSGAILKKLAPEWSFKDDVKNVYTSKFMNKINKLDADSILKELRLITNNAEKIVLLCHEKEGDFCHRRLVAKWIENKKGIKVDELGKMQKKKNVNCRKKRQFALQLINHEKYMK